MKILIAEDDSALQRIIGKLMKRWGFKFDIASNGKEAVEQAQIHEGEYDLCLMDIDMPIMNGCEATVAIRQTLDFFPILGLSSNLEAKYNYKKFGMDGFLEKPYGIDNLYKKIKELTVKLLKISSEQNTLALRKETPMNSEQLQELKDLEKRGLALLIIEGGQQRFVVHKNIQNKMSHILIGEGKELFEFLDRGENPANCHLYKCNMQTNRLMLTQEQYEERLKLEDGDIEGFTTIVDQQQSGGNKDK